MEKVEWNSINKKNVPKQSKNEKWATLPRQQNGKDSCYSIPFPLWTLSRIFFFDKLYQYFFSKFGNIWRCKFLIKHTFEMLIRTRDIMHLSAVAFIHHAYEHETMSGI